MSSPSRVHICEHGIPTPQAEVWACAVCMVRIEDAVRDAHGIFAPWRATKNIPLTMQDRMDQEDREDRA